MATTNTTKMVNIQKALPYTSIPNTANVTIKLTAAETTAGAAGATTAAAGAVAVTIKSKEKEAQEIPAPATTMTKEEALEKLQKFKDVTVNILGLNEIADAVKTVVREYTKKSGATVKEDGTIVIDVPKKTQTIAIDKAESSSSIEVEVEDTGESDIVVIQEEKKPVIISNADLTQGSITIEIPIEDLSYMNVIATQVSSDTDSITYRVTANVTHITKSTAISIDIENAITDTSTKTVSSDGSVSWNVTVLDKDGVVTIKRMDTGKMVSLELKGFDNKNTDKCPTTYDASLDQNGDYDFFIDINDKNQDGYFEDWNECKYYASGALEWNIPYIDDKINGDKQWYYESGQLHAYTHYVNGIKQGTTEWYYESGQLKEYDPFVNGMINGTVIGYYESGQMQFEYQYVNGNREGVLIDYYQNGQKHWVGHWTNDQKNGIEAEFDTEGNEINCRIFKNGEYMGPCETSGYV